MPRIVDLTQPYGGKGKYGDTFQGVANILDTIGKVERLRQERSLNAKVINVVAMGGGPQEIAKVLTEAQPQYESGAAGFLQKIANQFAPPSQLKSQFSQLALRSAVGRQGYGTTPWYLSPRWSDTPEGKAAKEKALKDKTPQEQLKYWLSIQNSAAGHYFYPGGLEGGAKEPKNREIYNLATKEINNLMKPPAQKPTEKGSTTTRTIPTEIVATQKGKIPKQSPIGLEEIWDEMNDDDKKAAMKLLFEGTPAEELVEHYKKKK